GHNLSRREVERASDEIPRLLITIDQERIHRDRFVGTGYTPTAFQPPTAKLAQPAVKVCLALGPRRVPLSMFLGRRQAAAPLAWSAGAGRLARGHGRVEAGIFAEPRHELDTTPARNWRHQRTDHRLVGVSPVKYGQNRRCRFFMSLLEELGRQFRLGVERLT